MSTVNKKFSFTIDVTHSLTNEQFQVVDGDSGNQLDITIVDDGTAVALTGTRVVLLFSKGSQLAMQDTTVGGGVTIDSSTTNLIHVDLFNGSFTPGLIECSIQVYSGDDLDTLVTTGSFNFRCVRSLIDDESIRSNNEYNILQSLINQVQGLTSNNQSDWTETDTLSNHYIKNKPSTFTPSTHASTHATGGTDAITPASIGAMASTATYSDVGAAPATHANQHKTGGTDALTPADIGAMAADVKGAANGVAELDSNTKVVPAQASSRIQTKTESFTLASGDEGSFIIINSASAVTVTIPSSVFVVGTEIEVMRYGAGAVTITGATDVTVHSPNNFDDISTQFNVCAMKCIGTNEWVLAGDLS